MHGIAAAQAVSSWRGRYKFPERNELGTVEDSKDARPGRTWNEQDVSLGRARIRPLRPHQVRLAQAF